VAFRYKELVYVNAALSVKNFNFSTTGLQRLGVGIKPKPEIMFGYQWDALDANDFKYHSIWVRYFFLSKHRGKSVENTSRSINNTPKPTTSTTKQASSKPKPTMSKPKTTFKKKP